MSKVKVFEIDKKIVEKKPAERQMHKLINGYAEVSDNLGEQPVVIVVNAAGVETIIDPQAFFEITMEFMERCKARYSDYAIQFDRIFEALKEVKI